MLTYVRTIRGRTLTERRRFVIIGTTLSFLIIVALWVAVRMLRSGGAGEENITPASLRSSPSPAFLAPSPTLSPPTDLPTPVVRGADIPSSQRPLPPSLPEASPAVSAEPFPTL